MSHPARSELPAFSFGSPELTGDQAFEAWRQIMARMFAIERSGSADEPPRGAMSAFLLGDVMANRSLFTTQRLTRDARRIGATPDHLVLQLYRSGGYVGEIGGDLVGIKRGQIAICDLRRTLDVQAKTSDTVGLTIPRHLLDGVDVDRLPTRLDPARERLLAARMRMLHLSLPKLAATEAAAATAEMLAVLRRLFDPSAAADVLEGRELDIDLASVAEQVMAGALASPHLSPAMIADRLRVSRATLFRAFAPRGGVMRHVWAMRLQAARAALDQPGEPRTLSRLAADLGFKSAAHLSRSFRTQFGMAPRDWRALRAAELRHDWQTGLQRLNGWWGALGR